MTSELDELIKVTAYQLGLSDPVFVEKDYYVTRVLHALADVENKYYQLIFIGALAWQKHIVLYSACQKILILKLYLKQSLHH